MLNGIIETIAIASSLLLAYNLKKNKELKDENFSLHTNCRNYKSKYLNSNHRCKNLRKHCLELKEISEFDNEVLTERVKQIGGLQEGTRKDKMEIADLNHQLCDANYKVVELECEMDSMVHRGWRKIMRARRLG